MATIGYACLLLLLMSPMGFSSLDVHVDNWDQTLSEPGDGCGGILEGDSGQLQSPDFGVKDYPNNTNCLWTIEVGQDRTIQLEFNSFDLESDSRCKYDSVTVYDGETKDSHKLGTFCGTSNPGILWSTGRYLMVEFVTDGSVQRPGFNASFLATFPGCGGLLTDSSGQLQSPGFGVKEYPADIKCVWEIMVPRDKTVQLEFSSIDVESDPSCQFDSVSVYNGETKDSLKIGTFCGRSNPGVFRSTGRYLMVEFVSDTSVRLPGFSASFIAKDCGGLLTDSSGQLQSPNFGIHYPNDANCVWEIRAEEGKIIQLEFRSFELEARSGSCYDSVTVYDGETTSGSESLTFCGTSYPRVLRSTGRYLMVKFISDTSFTHPGFHATYTTLSPGSQDRCAATESPGLLKYPEFGIKTYPSNADCTWTFDAGQNKIVRLTIKSFHTELDEDWVTFYDGETKNSPVIDSFSGKIYGGVHWSTGRYLTVHFKSYYAGGYSGFHLTYSAKSNM